MHLPDVTQNERAMDTFDRDYRQLPEWAHWTDNRAHKFAIIHNDRLYPSKMIVALATGVDRGKFSGGMQPGQAGWYADRAGLDVIELRTRNPTWSREELIVALDFYLSHRSHIPNKTSGEVKALSGAIDSVAAGNPYWVDSNEGASIEERVTVRYVPLSEPLWIGGPHEQIVAPLSVSRARGGTVFHVTPDQWEALAAFAAEIPRNTSDLEHLRKTPTGQGFGLSAAQRKAVEDHAMALALAHYGTLWVAVDDVHRHERKCRRGAVEHHVEVKGTTGPGNAVLLSKNEVQHAQDFFPNVSLFVVSEIQLDEDDEGFPIATGGHIRIIEPWRVTDCTLVAMTYQCFLPMFSPGSAERSVRTEEGQT